MEIMQEEETREMYLVVVNDEEQYSVWPTFKPVPAGWHEAGVRGSKQECLDHIERVWTDITPLSVRRRLEVLRRSDSDVCG